MTTSLLFSGVRRRERPAVTLPSRHQDPGILIRSPTSRTHARREERGQEAGHPFGSAVIVLPRILAVLPAAKAARYVQIENKIRAIVRYELAEGIPLVE